MINRFAYSLLVTAIALSMLGASLAHGLAHATQPGAGPYQEFVICANGTERLVLVDARGNPVDAGAPCTERLCPDCLTVTSAALPATGTVACRADLSRAAAATFADFALPNCRPVHEAARSPPHKV